MRHPIDPKIDCVFKALLGDEGNKQLLVHFLNAMLGDELPAPVVEVTISTRLTCRTGCRLRRCNRP